MSDVLQGWHPDTYRRHELRYYSGGNATYLVRDGYVEGTDPVAPFEPQPPAVQVATSGYGHPSYAVPSSAPVIAGYDPPTAYSAPPAGYGAPSFGYGGYPPPPAQFVPPVETIAPQVSAPPSPVPAVAPPPGVPTAGESASPVAVAQAEPAPMYAIFVYAVPYGQHLPSAPLPQLALVLPALSQESSTVAAPPSVSVAQPSATFSRPENGSSGTQPPAAMPMTFASRSAPTAGRLPVNGAPNTGLGEQVPKPTASASANGASPASARPTDQPEDEQYRASRRMWITLAGLMAIGIVIIIALIATN